MEDNTTETFYDKAKGLGRRGETRIDTYLNKYDPRKYYFPWIRPVTIVKPDVDKARQRIVSVVNTYKAIDTLNPSYNFQTDPSHISQYVSPLYSPSFRDNISGDMAEDIKKTQAELSTIIRHSKDDKMRENIDAVLNQMVTGFTQIYTTKPVSSDQIQQADAFKKLLSTLSRDIKTIKKDEMSFSQKGDLSTIQAEFAHKVSQYAQLISQDTTAMIDRDGNQVRGTFLRHPVPPSQTPLIYRDMWKLFLDHIEDSLVGAAQLKYFPGITPYEILIGKLSSTSQRRADKKFGDIHTVDPTAIRQFHEKIMIPLFMSGPNACIAYLTSEEWEKRTGESYLKRAGKKFFQGALDLGRKGM